MNINQLRAFINIVEKGTFSAAAKVLGISQPAVSLQIQSLEEYLGVDLLDRKTKKVRPTEAGKLFYQTAIQIVQQIDDCCHQLEELGESVRGKLAIGGSTIPGTYILPKLLGRFKKAYPDVSVFLKVADTSEIAEQVISGELHVGLVGAKLGTGHLNIRPFLSDELILIAPTNHSLAGKKSVSIDELCKADFITRERGSGTRQTIDNYLANFNLGHYDLNIVMELGSTESVVSAVSAGLGISIVSKWAAERCLKAGEIATANLPSPGIKRNLYLVVGKNVLYRPAQAFLSFIENLDENKVKP
ncbi:MAG: selenium metabolism-associated LysR family transcriptional regulator [Actinomycetota bacterium]|nr:selenium metabolism-associated LysR family transcriptional regulator [Actinomycetota bacterium]